MIEVCPQCGSTAILQQSRDQVQEIPDLDSLARTVRISVKVEEFKCQNTSCEHEFEKIIREPGP